MKIKFGRAWFDYFGNWGILEETQKKKHLRLVKWVEEKYKNMYST